MKFEKNESTLDRVVRVILGIILLLIGLTIVTGVIKLIFIAVGLIALLTGIVGFCGLYVLLGINTNKK